MGRRILRLAWRLVLSVGVLVVAAFLLLLVVNRKDQPPSALVMQLRAEVRARDVPPDAENAYVYVLGMSVPAEDDPAEWGVRRAMWAKQILAGSSSQAHNSFPGPERVGRYSRNSDIQVVLEACRMVDHACLALIEEKSSAINQWLAEEDWLRERYLHLLAHPAWQESPVFDLRLPLPSYMEPLDGQRLVMLSACLMAERGDADAVRQLLEKDLRFWRMVLASSDILISKMVAVRAIHNHFQWGNMALRRMPAERLVAAIPSVWHEEITKDERSMRRVFIGEWMFFDSEVSRGKEYIFRESGLSRLLMWKIMGPLFQVQESSNRHAERLMLVPDVLDVAYRDYPAALERLRGRQENLYGRYFIPGIYNPVGDMLYAMSGADFLSYSPRVVDVEGLRRVALLIAEARGKNIPLDAMDEHVVDSDLKNPYTEKPFEWDPRAGVAVFIGLAEPERARHVVLY